MQQYAKILVVSWRNSNNGLVAKDLPKRIRARGDKIVALENATLSVKEKSQVAIIGPVGSSKMTSMNLIIRLNLVDTIISG